jgi:hypothetical protein
MAIGTSAAILGSAVIGGGLASRASSRASRAQRQAADQSAQLQREMFNRQTELQEPFRQAGITSQNELLRMLGLGGDANSQGYGSLGRQFSATDMEMDPGYGFRLSEGMKALDRTAAARGGMMSGAALKAAGRFGQDMASQEYMNAFNRAQALKTERVGALGGLYGAGQMATNQVTSAAGQYGVNAGNMMMESGRARASGYIGSANAISNALGQAAMGYGMFGGGGRAPTSTGANTMAVNYQGPRYLGYG